MDQHLKKTFTGCVCQSQLDTENISTDSRAEMVLKNAALIVKQSLSGGCPTIDVCYHTDINGKQKIQNCNNNNNNMEYD
ncbi:hypothetical protein ABVT39_010254 [Epinephelus coioides]